jgi:hypothetical protein
VRCDSRARTVKHDRGGPDKGLLLVFAHKIARLPLRAHREDALVPEVGDEERAVARLHRERARVDAGGERDGNGELVAVADEAENLACLQRREPQRPL